MVQKQTAMLPKSWKTSFDKGTDIPAKMRQFNECSEEKGCDRCNIQISEKKEFEPTSNTLK